MFIAGRQAHGAAIERRRETPEYSTCRRRRFSGGRKRCLGIDCPCSRDSGRVNSSSRNGPGTASSVFYVLRTSPKPVRVRCASNSDPRMVREPRKRINGTSDIAESGSSSSWETVLVPKMLDRTGCNLCPVPS